MPMNLKEQILAKWPRSILDVVPREVFIELGQPASDQFILSGNCFEPFYAIAAVLQPVEILDRKSVV